MCELKDVKKETIFFRLKMPQYVRSYLHQICNGSDSAALHMMMYYNRVVVHCKIPDQLPDFGGLQLADLKNPTIQWFLLKFYVYVRAKYSMVMYIINCYKYLSHLLMDERKHRFVDRYIVFALPSADHTFSSLT